MPAARDIPDGLAAADRPAHRRHGVPRLTAEIRQRADIKRPLAVVFETGQRRMLAEDVMRMLPGKRLAIPQRLAPLPMIHQSAFASPGGGRKLR